MTATWNQTLDGMPPEHFTGRVDYKTRNGHDSHYYLLDGEKVDGVTTICKEGIPKGEGLMRFDRNQIAEAAVSQRHFWTKMDDKAAVKHLASQAESNLETAANRGTTVHDWAESFALNGELPSDVPEHLAGRAESFTDFIRDWNPRFLLVERVVFNPLHLYAGTLDAIMVLPQLGNTLADYKTAKKAYPEHAIQLSAYRYSTFWIDEETGTRIALPRIDSTVVILLGDHGYEVVPVSAGRREFDTFLKAQHIAEFCRHGRTVVGKPLGAPQATPSQGSD